MNRLLHSGLLVPRRRLSSETLVLVPVVASVLAAVRRSPACEQARLLTAARKFDPDQGVKKEGSIKWFNEKLSSQLPGCMMVKDPGRY